jgi:tRNA-splicing ligase RtcB
VAAKTTGKELVMKRVIGTEKHPIKLWTDDLGEKEMAQARNVANLPFLFKHFSLMPDGHMGYGAMIGSVFATTGPVIPGAVGSDVSCGMGAVRTSLTHVDTPTLKKLLGLMRRDIPVGFAKRKQRIHLPFELSQGAGLVTSSELVNSSYQLGTLGSGNHFEQISIGSDGYIWLMVHSGSRHTGKLVCDHYDALARDLNQKYFSSVPDKWKLAFLPYDSEEHHQYMAEMNWCMEYAFHNRRVMLDIIKEHLFDLVGGCDFDDTINIAHNFAALEHHFGRNVLVHRKGATRAYEGELGIVPGSQGTPSYIVRGKGEVQSFKSCSHGAGRTMGRRAAKENLDLATEIKILEDQGILHSIRGKAQLDEATSAYKDISVVMENQVDLVDIVVELSPLAVVKG